MAFLSPRDRVKCPFCTYCLHSPIPAVKSCLVCDAFLCDVHLVAHTSTEHVLFHPVTFKKNLRSPVHEKILEGYCPEETCPPKDTLDSQIGVMGQKLKNAHKKLTRNREETKERVHRLRERRKKNQETAMGTSEKAAAMFRDMRRHLDDLEQRFLREIARQEEQASLSISDLIQQLELKREDLSRKICHIEALCHITNPMVDPEEGDTVEEEGVANIEPDHDADLDGDVILDTLYQGLSDIVVTLQRSHRTHERAFISLDVNTAADNVYVTPCLQSACVSTVALNWSEILMRSGFNQVLSSGGFSSGRHYWDVETNDTGDWRVGASYYRPDREGDQDDIGCNGKSWCLWGYYNNLYVAHDRIYRYIPLRISSHMFRIYLDYEAGQLSFYEVGGPMRHLYTFNATFTAPLHAAFSIGRSFILIRN